MICELCVYEDELNGKRWEDPGKPKVLAAQVGPYRISELWLTKKSVLSEKHSISALDTWM